MIYLLLSILISSLLFAIFKLFEVYKINTLQAIVTNYLVAFLVGLSSSNVAFSIADIPQKPWFIGAVLLGLLFISVFNIMALTAQKNGLSVASVAGKMSVVVPIIFAVIVYNESLGFLKIIGIILALIAVYLTATKSKIIKQERKYLIYPLLLFLGSGIIDTSIKYVETNFVSDNWLPIFSATIFLIAFFFGCFLIGYKLINKQTKLESKNIIGGIVLGIPNYYSIVFLLKALKTDGLESSTIFTINNVGIVVLTTIFGLLLFKEKLETKNWIGIAIAVVSIVLVSIS